MTPVDVIRSRVIEHYLDDEPISAILEIQYHFEKDCESLIPFIRADFLHALAEGVYIKHKADPVILVFDETHPESRHFTTRSGYNEYIKDVVVKEAVDRCNRKYKHRSVSIQYVLASLIHYMRLNWEE